MFELLFVICMVVVFGKMIGLAFKMTWGITKILLNLVLLPLVLIVMLFSGLAVLALPLLIIAGIISLVIPGR